MKKHKNAFTLIELLAVIVILAIIALIATPIILGIVEDAKKDAFLRSVELVISTTDIDITNKTFEEEYTYTITDGDISNLEVGVKNTNGMNGSITYDINGNESYAVHNGVYCVTKTFGSSKAEIKDYKEGECTLNTVVVADATPEACFGTEDLADGGVMITYYYDYENNDSNNKACPNEVVIPSTINGKIVKRISEPKDEIDVGDGRIGYTGSFSDKQNVTSVKFPSSIESIGHGAFGNCSITGELDLSHLTNLTTIERMAFRYNEITSIKLPNSITSIEDNSFTGNKLTGVLDLSNTNITSIGATAFSGEYGEVTNQITSIKFPNTIETIGTNAFAYNAFTGELDLSNTNVASIGDNAFRALCIEDEETYEEVCMGGITSVKLPSSLTSIEDGAFYRHKISSMTFYGRSDLTGIEVDFEFFGGWAEGYNETNAIHFVNE